MLIEETSATQDPLLLDNMEAVEKMVLYLYSFIGMDGIEFPSSDYCVIMVQTKVITLDSPTGMFSIWLIHWMHS